METLSQFLAPYSETIGHFAGFITCVHFLTGLFLLNDIRQLGSSDPYPPDPLLGGIILTVLSIKLGSLMSDESMIKINLVGVLLNMLYMVVFYWYASALHKLKILIKILKTVAFIGACMAYTRMEKPEVLEFRLGLIITAILVVLVGAPLLNINEIRRQKSTDGLPFPVILAGTLVAAIWTVYGIAINNPVIFYQNLFLLLLSAIQLSLFVIYPNNKNGDKLKERRRRSSRLMTPLFFQAGDNNVLERDSGRLKDE